ncbi:MAG: ATP-binding cassette domain-containing protein [Hydrogenophaga sp.]|jgi:phospholipid/cholesterol/gamma-HCH transport system ATP-binding protein|uniref:ABC transporter ATP-binding protein n=1 Tax=Hydrogenophaga sp. TaxID=1904254 RepID=UPI00272410C5|nr:ATP-binding cassette domain-containing protein [Hydrogenophaga sp.]MDO9570499.1 ATP-binding cassette domain-containing protein [Hydrogenophaga sp.]
MNSPALHSNEPVIELRQIATRFGSHTVHEGLDLSVRRGEILGLAGGSGAGKSVLLREMIGLQRPSSGQVLVFGEDLSTLSAAQAQALRLRWGVMFQRGGLFGSISVRANVGLPLREHRQLASAEVDRIAEQKLALTGLPSDAGLKHPNELSGGMLKRAALARAIALDPELLFLDEPTSGLDPASSRGVDELILDTQAASGATVVIVTHDVDLMWRVCDRVAVLGEGHVMALGTMEELSSNPAPAVAAYFTNPREARTARAAQPAAA